MLCQFLLKIEGWFQETDLNECRLPQAEPHEAGDVTLVVPDVDAWYEHFRKTGVETLSRPRDNEELNLRMFLLEDPEGHVIEI